MKIGFSGTRSGLGESRVWRLRDLLSQDHEPGAEFHHGCCVGSDVEAAAIAMQIGYRIIAHPPIKTDLLAPQALWFADELRQPKSYFARNRDIVDDTDRLIAAPPNDDQVVGGGTWYTVGYARKRGKPVELVLP